MDFTNRMYVHGEWVDSEDGQTLPIVDPATEELIGTVPRATAGDVARALESTAAGHAVWREVDAWTRSRTLRRMSDYLREHLEEITAALTAEQGKPLGEARAETVATVEHFEWFGEEAKRIYGRTIDGHSRGQRLLVMRQPIGPVAAFAPWNFPIMLAARKVAPALAAGCAVLLKPPREAPRSALWLARAGAAAGLPPGALNIVTGDAGPLAAQLIASPVIRKVSLTGSVPVGQELMRLCAEQVKPLTLELGGHSPVLVFADADVEQAAELCARAKFRNCGQVCISASRFYVEESVADRFRDRFVAVARGLRVGDGRLPDTDVGPLANPRRVAAAEHLVRDALDKGARLLCGGGRPDGLTRGFFFAPTVIDGVDPRMAVMVDEPFGPVAPIATFTDLADGLQQANATQFGLAGYLFTTSTRTAFLAAEGLDVGMVGVNTLLLSTPEAPFGGVKRSGFGREGGTEWIDAYTVAKYLNISL